MGEGHTTPVTHLFPDEETSRHEVQVVVEVMVSERGGEGGGGKRK